MTGRSNPRKSLDAFISYSREDERFAARISSVLKKHGISMIDPTRNLKPGANAYDSVINGSRNANYVIFVVPAREGEGKFALSELGAARAMGKRIVAVMPDGSRAWNSDFARVLSKSPVVDASNLKDEALAGALALAS
jgi:hypothetical protein